MDMGEKEIWAKPLNDGELAVCFMNRTETAGNWIMTGKTNHLFCR